MRAFLVLLAVGGCGEVERVNHLPDAPGAPREWVPVGNVAAFGVFSVTANLDSEIVVAGSGGTGNDCRNAPKQPGCDIYRSGDDGATFDIVTVGLDHVDVRGLAAAGAIVIATSRGAFGVSDDRLLLSEDAGRTWSVISSSADVGEQNKAVAIDPRAPVDVYAADFQLASRAAGDSFLLRSRDAGRTWAHLPETAGNELRGYAMTFAAGALYVGGTGTPAIARTRDGGVTFVALGLIDQLVYSLAVDPETAVIYAGTRDNGVHRSIDGGVTFTRVGPAIGTVEALLIDPATPATIYAGTSTGAYVTTDRGESWNRFDDGLPASIQIHALAITRAGTLIAGTSAGLFRRVPP